MLEVENCARLAGSGGLWLSAWERNTHALAFYQHLNYQDMGLGYYVIQGQSFGNRILYKPVCSSNAESLPTAISQVLVSVYKTPGDAQEIQAGYFGAVPITQGARIPQVKTLAESHPSRHYAETRAFYESAGDLPMEVFPLLWQQGLPVLLLVKVLVDAGQSVSLNTQTTGDTRGKQHLR